MGHSRVERKRGKRYEKIICKRTNERKNRGGDKKEHRQDEEDC